jgi:SAM-dependent methyltransferase
LPFAPGSFDKVFCFGVLQHTPDVRKSVESLAAMVKPGGELVVDFYSIRGPWTKLHAKYLLRPWTKNMNHQTLLKRIEANIDWMIAATQFFNGIGVGRFVNRFIPVCDIKNTFPSGLSKEQTREWAILDTFDMFSPQYDQPQRIATVRRWFEELGFENIFAGNVRYGLNTVVAIVKGNKPCAA